MSDKTEANPVLQKNKSNNTSNEQSKEPDMKTRFNMLRKMKEDLEKMNRRERRYAVEDEDNDNVHSIKAGNCCTKKKDDNNSLLKLVEKKKKKMMIQKKYESMNGVNTGIIQENNESEEESNSKSNKETPHKFKEGKFMNSLNNVKEFKTEDDVEMVNKEEKDKIVEEDEDGNGSDEQNDDGDNKEDEGDKKEDVKEEEKIKEEKNIIKQRLLKLALDKKMKKEEEIKEKSKDIDINNDDGNNGDDDYQNENNNHNDVNDDNNKNDNDDKIKEYNEDNNDEIEFNPSSLLLKDNSSSKKELRNIISILKSKSNKQQQQKEPTSDTNTDQIVPNETSPQKTTTSQENNNNIPPPSTNNNNNNTSDSPNNKANNSSSNDDDDNNNDKDNNNNIDNPPQPPEPTEEEQQQLQYKKELEERAIKRNKYLEFKKQQVIQKRKYEEELAEQKRLEEIQRKEEERLAEIEKKRKEELIRLERQQQAEAREAEKKKREERKRRDAMRKAGEQRLEREVKRQEQRKEFEFKRLELKLNNKGKDVITVNGSFDRSIDNINNESNSNYFSELTYVKQTPISKRKNICDIASSPKIDDVKKDNFRQNNKIDVKKNNLFETETKIKMKAPVTLIYSPKRAGRSSSNDKLSRSIVDVNEIKENKAYNANQPYVKQRSGGLSVGKKNNNVNVSNQYNNNNLNVRKNPFMNYNNNIHMNNRTQTNFGQDALIDDHYTTINHHHHNINNTNITNIRTNFYTTMPNFNYNTNNNSNNNSNINNNTNINTNSNNSINQFNNNNINNYSQVGSLLPPAPPTPQPKAQYSLNIEDLITLEEKLSEITSALNLNQYIRNECFEWWNYYFNHSNYSQIHLTFDKAHQPFIERSVKYQILSILICYDISSDQYVLSSIEHMIQAILNRNHMNFILVCEYVLSKISLDNYDNVWVYKLRNLVNTHKLNYVNFINEYSDNVSYVDKINSNTNSVINDIRIIVKYYQNRNPKADELLYLLKKIEQLSYNEINAIVQEKFMIGQKMNSNILPYDYNYNSSLRESNNFNFFSENTSCNMGVNGGNGNNYFNGGNNSGFYLDTQDVYGNNMEMNGNYY